MTSEPREVSIQQERKFNQNLDLSPLEHLLIGSGTRLPNGTPLTRGLLSEDENIARDKDFLLKPNGLRIGGHTIEEIREGRRQKTSFSFTASFLKLRGEFIFNYSFNLSLPQVDAEGHISPEFTMQMQKSSQEGHKSLVALEGEDRSVFEQIELDPSVRTLFSLEKNPNIGMLVLRYLPLQKQTKK